jgi:hypothetical protein
VEENVGQPASRLSGPQQLLKYWIGRKLDGAADGYSLISRLQRPHQSIVYIYLSSIFGMFVRSSARRRFYLSQSGRGYVQLSEIFGFVRDYLAS